MACRWCGSSSHNRTTCAKRLDYVKNNPTSWEAKRHAEMQSNPHSARHCSWCHEAGHGRNKCNNLVNDIIAMTNKNKAFRKAALEYMSTKCLGIGALVECGHVWGYDSKGEYGSSDRALGMVIDINWNTINYPVGGAPSVMVEFMNIYAYGGVTKHKVLYELDPVFVYNHKAAEKRSFYGNEMNVVSPGHIMIDNEAEWLKGHLNKNEFDRSYAGHRRRGHSWAVATVNSARLFG